MRALEVDLDAGEGPRGVVAVAAGEGAEVAEEGALAALGHLAPREGKPGMSDT